MPDNPQASITIWAEQATIQLRAEIERLLHIKNDLDEFSQFLSAANTYSPVFIPTVQRQVERLRGYDAEWTTSEATLDKVIERLSVGDIEILASLGAAKDALSKARLDRDQALTLAGKLLVEIDVRGSATDPQSGQAISPAPPSGASFLLDLFLAKTDRLVLPGDMQQEFTAKLAEYGPRRARLWFWVETTRVIAHRNPVCRWILVVLLTEVGKWIKYMMGG